MSALLLGRSRQAIVNGFRLDEPEQTAIQSALHLAVHRLLRVIERPDREELARS